MSIEELQIFRKTIIPDYCGTKYSSPLEVQSGTTPIRENSFHASLSDLLWYDAVFRFVLEGRKNLPEGPHPTKGFNPYLAELLDEGYKRIIVLGIRAICERKQKREKREVISLPTFIGKVKEKIHLFTRLNYVCQDNIPYDIEGQETNHRTELIIQARHNDFDFLSQRDSSCRSKSDSIKTSLLKNRLEALSNVSSKMKYIADKYYAHIAHRKTYGHKPPKELQVELSEIDQCLKEIIKTVGLTNKVLNCFIPCDIPPPPDNFFIEWDKPLFDPKDAQSFDEIFNIRRHQIDSWLRLQN